MRPIPIVLRLLLWVGLSPMTIIACRYNVRDIGFVDLESEVYQLFGYVRETTPEDVISALRETAATVLAESNIHFEVVNIDRDKQHRALQYLSPHSFDLFPAAVLVSPDGQSLPIVLSEPGRPIRQTMRIALQQIVSSPEREEIVRQASRAFGVVLFLEGPRLEENRRARQAIASAIQQIESQRKTMPKLIPTPPIMVVLESAAVAQERVLLWSLGLATNRVSQALAAVVYGRARWMGPLMKGEEITDQNLSGILSMIGTDCECDLDLSWTQGTRLPVRWSATLKSDVVRRLGFDPENPAVRMEVGRILDRHGSSVSRDTRRDATLMGTRSAAAGEISSLRRLILIFAGLGMVVVVVGIGIVLRAARRR